MTIGTYKRPKVKSRKLVIYHGTSRKNAEKIMKEGFKVEDVKRNWEIPSKAGFVYFSLAYAPFYAMNTDDDDDNEQELAIIKVEIDEHDLYPEDDFLMYARGKPRYTEEDLADVDYEKEKPFWVNSLKYMGNVAAKPDKVKIVGVKYFNGRELIMKCDPVIVPENYRIMGDYYLYLTEQIYQGVPIRNIRGPFDKITEEISQAAKKGDI